MASQKKPFHEILAKKLEVSRSTMLRCFSSAEAAGVRTILEVLLEGKMPSAAAHQIAFDQTGLPTLLTAAGEERLSRFAGEVLRDLKEREDEKNHEGEPIGIVIGRALSNLTPEK